MALRNIIEIDEERCDGCGQCVTGCAEGALAVRDGKARLVSDIYCDGLGACLEECPRGALRIIQRDAPEFNESAVEAHLTGRNPVSPQTAPLACGCSGSLVQSLKPYPTNQEPMEAPTSQLGNWPIQLHLVPVQAPFFHDAALMIVADCAGFAVTDLHQKYLPRRALIIACPKLDDTRCYLEKMTDIVKSNQIKDISVLYMTVPCCSGLVHLVRTAVKNSGRAIPLRLIQVDPNGEIVDETREKAA